jgi:hypothetical protein
LKWRDGGCFDPLRAPTLLFSTGGVNDGALGGAGSMSSARARRQRRNRKENVSAQILMTINPAPRETGPIFTAGASTTWRC